VNSEEFANAIYEKGIIIIGSGAAVASCDGTAATRPHHP
jgi:uncharacterized protein with ACT and thioredoxin-like domain